MKQQIKSLRSAVFVGNFFGRSLVEDASPAFWLLFPLLFFSCVWLGILSQSRCKVICAVVVQGPSSLLCYYIVVYGSRFGRHKAGKNQGKNEAADKKSALRSFCW